MSQPTYIGNEWIKRIKKGDVLRSGNGVLRVVRDVSHSKISHYDVRTTLVFSIRRCSWTGRCYTVYTGNDLVQMGYRPTRAKVKLTWKIDKAIEREITTNPPPGQYGLKCCDVENVW